MCTSLHSKYGTWLLQKFPTTAVTTFHGLILLVLPLTCNENVVWLCLDRLSSGCRQSESQTEIEEPVVSQLQSQIPSFELLASDTLLSEDFIETNDKIVQARLDP